MKMAKIKILKLSCHNKRKDKSQQNREVDNSPSKKIKFKEISYFYISIWRDSPCNQLRDYIKCDFTVVKNFIGF